MTISKSLHVQLLNKILDFRLKMSDVPQKMLDAQHFSNIIMNLTITLKP